MDLSKTGEPLKLTWDAVVLQFKDLVKFAAKQQVQNRGVDSMLSVEDVYQEGMIKLYDCWVKWCFERNKDMDEFGPIFRKSLFRCVRNASPKKHKFTDIEDAENTLEDVSTEDVTEKLYRQKGLSDLMDSLDNSVARKILMELIDPSARTLFEVWADISRKKMLKSQGKRVNIPKDNTIRMKHIIRSIGVSQKQYDIAMIEIREKAPVFLQDTFS